MTLERFCLALKEDHRLGVDFFVQTKAADIVETIKLSKEALSIEERVHPAASVAGIAYSHFRDQQNPVLELLINSFKRIIDYCSAPCTFTNFLFSLENIEYR